MSQASRPHSLFTGGVALVAFVAVLRLDFPPEPVDPLDAAIAGQTSRVEAAHAALGARPLIGDSHLPPYDAAAAIVREESVLRRLTAQRSVAR